MVKEFVGCNDKDNDDDDEKMNAKDFVLRSIETTQVRSETVLQLRALVSRVPWKTLSDGVFPTERGFSAGKIDETQVTI